MRRRFVKACIVLGCICLAMAAAVIFLRSRSGEPSECPAKPETGRWYSVAPEGAVTSEGRQWKGRLKLGRENRVLVYLLGGGVSLDAYSAARSGSAAGADGFYYDRDDGLSERRLANGIGSDSDENPFRDWTVILVPYTTGDFHAGSGKADYVSLDGEPAVIHHNGYDNCMAMLRQVRSLVGEPETLLIAGYSAGGFGAAMLAEDIISYFPDTRNITVCVDGALLINDRWQDVAAERWHAPEKIVDRTVGGNLTLDHLLALHAARSDVKILFTCSTRDGGLAKYQSYIDGNAYAVSEAYGDVMETNLRETVAALREKIPGCGVYLWNSLPYGDSETLTKHTILTNAAMFAPMQEDVSISSWIMDAVNGRVESYGLSLLEE